MRGNWVCCLTPNLTGVLTQTNGTWSRKRQLVGAAHVRRHDRNTGQHVRAGRFDRDLRVRGLLGAAGRGHPRRLQRIHRHRDGHLQRTVVDAVAVQRRQRQRGGRPDPGPVAAHRTAGRPQPEHEHVQRLHLGAGHLPGVARRVRRLPHAGHVGHRRGSGRVPPVHGGEQRPVPGCLRQHRCGRRGDRSVDVQRSEQPAVPVRRRSRAATASCRRRIPDWTWRWPTARPSPARPTSSSRRRTAAANSLWLPVQQSDGSYQFQNKNSNLCLDVYGASSNLGQQLDQWTCKNAPGTNQDFTASA